MPTGAQLIVDLLEQAGVEVASGCPGVHNLALWEALRESPIRLVGVRHEQAAAYAADGYARATGRLGVALTTTGPGAANTLGAVGEAWASRSPILVIATDIPARAAPRRASTAACCTRRPTRRRCSRRSSKARARGAPAEDRRPRGRAAIATPSRAPTRPVYLEIADRPARRRGAGRHAPPRAPRAAGAERRLDRGGRRCSTRAERPLIWAGGGARDARRRGRARWPSGSARRCSRPTARAGVLPPGASVPRSACRRTSSPPGALWDEADLVIAIGSDLDGVQTQNFAQPQPPR